jgi:hypothetical protein
MNDAPPNNALERSVRRLRDRVSGARRIAAPAARRPIQTAAQQVTGPTIS